MRDAMLDMMATLAAAVVSYSWAADELTEAADRLGDEHGAEQLRAHARYYRVEALKLQGRLAGLTNTFVERFGAI